MPPRARIRAMRARRSGLRRRPPKPQPHRADNATHDLPSDGTRAVDAFVASLPARR
jgi:hypothetical protein